MAVSVAEYLGVDIRSGKNIIPQLGGKGSSVPCPFRNGHCDKIAKGNKPICSVRDGSDVLWIVCPHRLCASSPKDAPLNSYQVDVLQSIGETIWGIEIDKSDIAVRREAPVRTIGRPNSYADFVMVPTPKLKSRMKDDEFRPVVLEMQGGGETNNTGALTEIVGAWELEPDSASNLTTLSQLVKEVGTIEANAWRRQQEQFLYKGNVAVNSSGRLVFAVGSKLFDYLLRNLADTNIQDLRGANWTLALIGISEDLKNSVGSFGTADSVRLKIDDSKLLFTSYSKFVNALINQGGSDDLLFKGNFLQLDGVHLTI
jgi:hypothetical protein